jgi:hypothetical protein
LVAATAMSPTAGPQSGNTGGQNVIMPQNPPQPFWK